MRVVELAEEVVVHLRVQVGLGRIDLVDIRIAENAVIFRSEWYDQSDAFLLGELGKRLDMLLVQGAEDDVDILHGFACQDILDGSLLRTRVVGIEVDGNARFLQAVHGHEESFVVFNHACRLVLLASFGQQGEDDGRLEGGIFFGFYAIFPEEFAVGRRFFRRNDRFLLRRLRIRDAKESAPLYLVFPFQFGIGGDEFFFRDAIFTADAIDGLPASHFVHFAASGLHFGAQGDGVFRLGFRRGGLCFRGRDRYADDFSGVEIDYAEPRIGFADGLYGHAITLAEPIERLARLDGVEGFLHGVGRLAGDAQLVSYVDALVASGVQLDDVALADSIHAGDGVEALSFLNGVQDV